MCGRTAYSSRATSAAATAFSRGEIISREEDVGGANSREEVGGGANNDRAVAAGKSVQGKEETETTATSTLDHYSARNTISIPSDMKDCPNAGPGHEFRVFRRLRSQTDEIECTPMIWGLLPNNGTHNSPHLLPSNFNFSASPHYNIFNARSETVYDKISFRGIRNGQTCVLAVDGYYEWTKTQSLHDKRKQPYFICNSNKQQPLLLAGIWSCVKTGRQIRNASTNNLDDEMITTFTILTMDAHPKFAWIHDRQPAILPDVSTALEWLMRPSPALVERLRSATKEETSLLAYPVSKKMNDSKYQGNDCMKEVKLEKAPSVKSFFLPAGGSAKRAKIEKKVGGIGGSPPSHKPSSSPSKGKESIVQNDPQEGVPHEKGGEDLASWTCSKCTFVHTGSVKLDYLACEVCGSERAYGQKSGSPEQSKSKDASHPNDEDANKGGR